MTSSLIIAPASSFEQAPAFDREVGTVVVVVTLALELIGSGAAAS